MAYVKANNGTLVSFPYSLAKLRSDNSNTSFPKTIPEATLADWGVHVVTESAVPVYDARTQKVERQDPQLSGSSWVMSWSVLSKTQAEVEEYDASMASKNRQKRNELLSQTDYYALTDVTMDAAMTSYRQSLRDITSHSNWPNLNDDDWPTKPE